jgi:hypothetical protein
MDVVVEQTNQCMCECLLTLCLIKWPLYMLTFYVAFILITMAGMSLPLFNLLKSTHRLDVKLNHE